MPDGTLPFSWGEPGSAPGQFQSLHNIRVDKQERVWVADRENNRIQISDARGKFLTQWTGLKRPADLCFDEDGTVYVVEM